jgi:hypothetical protein
VNSAAYREESEGRRLPVVGLAAAGLILAAALVAGFMGNRGGSDAAVPKAPAPAQAVPFAPFQDYPTLVLYIVDSQEQVQVALASEAQAGMERASAGIADPDYRVQIIDTSAPYGAEALRELLSNWSEGLVTVDLRTTK